MATILVAYSMVDSRCATMNVVRPFISLASAILMRCSFSASRALVASSRIRIGASFNNALAIEMRCFCPPDSRLPASPTGVSRPLGRDETNSVRKAKRLKKQVIEDFKKIPIDKDKKVPKVYLIGEFFVLLDPYTNQNIEKELGEMGVEVQRQIMFSDWLEHVLKPSIFYKKESHRERCVKYAKKYMKRAIGGECIETIGDTVYAAKHGIDGIIHISPFSCMPEIVAQNILPKVSKNENIPVLSLVLDEQTGKAGYITRIEAFIDLIKRRQQKYAI